MSIEYRDENIMLFINYNIKQYHVIEFDCVVVFSVFNMYQKKRSKFIPQTFKPAMHKTRQRDTLPKILV
mgnify:CR=1 FL=1